ncbi:MAG: Na+/H+ antiporter NhaA [Myxococcales bacterium]
MSTPEPTPSNPLSSSPPEAGETFRRLLRAARRPLERFFHLEAASGLLLLASAAIALAWASSPWSGSYAWLWHTPLGIQVGGLAFERTLEWVVNDGLMVIFFFVVGLEIRREIHDGELSEWRRAALPAAAALGGMVVPAGAYLVFAGAPESRAGWGVPMATDIAFAVAILTLLGKRVPAAVRVLLLALAIIDDLGAIFVIALFYSSGIALWGLLLAGAGLAAVWVMQRLGVRAKLAYVPPALVAWAGIYGAGVHPTIAGVIIGLMTPVAGGPHDVDPAGQASSPAQSLIESLHPWVAFVIMPIFALANAGVVLEAVSLDATSWRVATAVVGALVLGKPLGVLLACWLALQTGVARLPRGVTLRHLVVLGSVAGVGFTMSLFIAQLAFADVRLLTAAKLGVLVASAVAAAIALVLGRLLLTTSNDASSAATADEAERSTLR